MSSTGIIWHSSNTTDELCLDPLSQDLAGAVMVIVAVMFAVLVCGLIRMDCANKRLRTEIKNLTKYAHENASDTFSTGKKQVTLDEESLVPTHSLDSENLEFAEINQKDPEVQDIKNHSV